MKNRIVLCVAVAILAAIASAMATNEKPVIIKQPTSVKAKIGDSVTFTVGAVDVNTKNEKNFTTAIMGKVNLDMVWCPPGTFMMGSPETEMGHKSNETLHQVTLTKGFWIGKYEVTQAQYKAVMGEIAHSDGDNYPVRSISWEDANTFCERLTQVERAAGRITMLYKYTLPTEAQWEYACRAGTTTGLNSGKELITSWLDTDANLDEVGWYFGNSGLVFHRIGQKLPNAWGLYDMHGNVWEWCLDGWKENLGSKAVTDPITGEDSNRVRRGGSMDCGARDCRSAVREGHSSDYDYLTLNGIRVALVPVE